jgi:glycosyltransferase involved in cell wall biosynthesis
MRVLSVNHLLDPVSGGGTAERTFQLLRALAAGGIECTALTLDIGIDARRRAELGSVRIVALPCLFRRYFVPRVSWRRLKREVEAAHVVHIMGHWTLLNALVFLAARSARRPYVISPAGALAIVGRSRPLKWLYNFLVGNRLVRSASAHIAITPAELPWFAGHGVPAGRVTVIPNGAPAAAAPAPECADFLRRHGLSGRRFVLFLGRLAYVKGPDLLLEAYAAAAPRLAGLDLVYAGPDDGMAAELRERASRHGLQSRVKFTGYAGAGEKACLLGSCEFLAIPSRQEAMSIVALEAAMHRKAVLLTDRCGFDEVERVGGGRVAAATTASLESLLVEMAADPAALVLMGARLEAHVRHHSAWERAAARHADLFREVAAAAPACAS